ncbi:MAG TPA: lipid IV(A) 3-deoxy-D-manno-octulosonic acid transferase [Rhodanobacteraceae bacterium]|nr:lipid IV(A) 3-deoxy-D-manno-octulosonic acid transferase [Rhodanobacteraceae bacterium]
MRFFYTLIMYLGTPVIVYRLASRGLHYRGYFSRWRERFGFFDDPGLRDSIWVHAVSVGEVNAAVPLVEALMARYPGRPCVLTTITPTGSERVRTLFGDRVFHVYLPYDLPASVRRFLDRVRPSIGVIMETEIWPNLYFECHRRGLPLVLANARLSERSLRAYRPVRPLAGGALQSVRWVAAQSPADARRFELLGAQPERIRITGNLKFDMDVPTQLLVSGSQMRAGWGAGRPVWMAASTHEGEELAVFTAHLEVLRRLPDALLLIAPRHPERFRAAEQSARNLGFRVATRSEDSLARPSTQCFVIDSMGEMMRFFASADVAFVGGSLVTRGGHNVLEPAALGRPVLVGPYTFNFAEITRTLVAAGGARRVEDSSQLGAVVCELLSDPGQRQRMGAHACAVFDGERGAVARTMALIEPEMP